MFKRKMVTPCLIWARRLLFVALIIGIVFMMVSFNPFSKKETANQMDHVKCTDRWKVNNSKGLNFNKSHCEIPLKTANITNTCTKPSNMEMQKILPHNGTQVKSLKGYNNADPVTKAQTFTKKYSPQIHENIHLHSLNGSSAHNRYATTNHQNVVGSTHNLKQEKAPEQMQAVLLSNTHKPSNATNTISLKNFKAQLYSSNPKVFAKHINSKPQGTNHHNIMNDKNLQQSNIIHLSQTLNMNGKNSSKLQPLAHNFFTNEKTKNDSTIIHLHNPKLFSPNQNLTRDEKKPNESKMINLNGSKLQPQNFIFHDDKIFKEMLSSTTKENMRAKFFNEDHQNLTKHNANGSSNIIRTPTVKQHQNLTQKIENIFKNISSFSIFNKDHIRKVLRSNITNLPVHNFTVKIEKIIMDMLSPSAQGNKHAKSLNKTHQNLHFNKRKIPESKFNITQSQHKFANLTSSLSSKTKNSAPNNIAHALIEDILLCSSKPSPGKTIFFSASSQYLDIPYNIQEMRAHQACAIESAALHNQNFQVFVLFACRTYLEKPAHIIDALLSYKNIKFRELNIGTYILDTPITDWLKLNDFYRSSFLMHHLSDLLRLLTLYRYGGIYLDMDVMLLRTFEDLHLNYACSMGNQSISNSILGLEPKGFGHQLAEWLLQDFRKNLVRDSFDSTEHKFLLRVLQEVCSTRNVTLMVRDPKRCKGFRVFNVSEFYEVPLKQSELLLDQNLASEMLERIKNSRIIHIWNRFSAKWPLKTDSKSAYMQLAAKHCPKVFKAAGDFFS